MTPSPKGFREGYVVIFIYLFSLHSIFDSSNP